MKKILLFLFLFGICAAADKLQYYPINDVFNMKTKEGKIIDRSKFHFGDEFKNPPLRNASVKRKANGFGKDDKKACDWAFLASLKVMEDMIKKEGGKKAVNCHFESKTKVFTDKNRYLCSVGFLMNDVTLVCDILK